MRRFTNTLLSPTLSPSSLLGRGFLATFRGQDRDGSAPQPPQQSSSSHQHDHPDAAASFPERGPDGSKLPTADERKRGFDEYGVDIATAAPSKAWTDDKAALYGEGTHAMFRQVYKELVDEMRREATTRPPPPAPGAGDWTVTHRASANVLLFTRLGPAVTTATAKTPASDQQDHRTAEVDAAQPQTSEPSSSSSASDSHTPTSGTEPSATPPSSSTTTTSSTETTSQQPQSSDSAEHHDADAKSTQLNEWRVDVIAPIALEDPPRLNEAISFLNWFPLEVYVTKGDIVVHFSIAANEGGMHMRNTRVHRLSTLPAAVDDTSATGLWTKRHLLYDGPFLMHLEMDVQNELYDLMMDYGVTLDWARWAAEWVEYQEHVVYVKWSLAWLQHMLPEGMRGPESDFMTEEEKDFFSRPSEDWLPIKYV